MASLFHGSLSRWRSVIALLILTLAFSFMPALSGTVASNRSSARSGALVVPLKGGHFQKIQSARQPPSDASCRAQFNIPCYSPQEIRTAYNVNGLLKAGYTGKGQSIVIIDSFGSPTIQSDLQVFDKDFGLPNPKLTIVSPLGTLPFDPNNSDMVGWAAETTLDVEWAHAMAPEANIVLMTSPVSETQGVQGMPEFLFLEQYAVDNHLGKIISQSWGTTENTLFTTAGELVLDQFENFYAHAAKENVTVFASSGDSGASNVDVNGNTYPFPTVGFPASSPYVTAVGGTSLYADTSGNYQSETVWNDSAVSGGASGGGVSQFFKEPAYQKSLPKSDQAILNNHRGLPDVAYNADEYTGVLVYLSFIPGQVGYYEFGGTSAGSPQWAGIIADANQLAGRPLGFLNNALYQLGKSSDYTESFHDITVGNNSYAGVTGYNATSGWDPATGWGTPKTTNMVTELIERVTGKGD